MSVTMVHSGDYLALCKYDFIEGDLFILSWARVQEVRQGNISSELLMCTGHECSFIWSLLASSTNGNIKHSITH